MQGQPACDSPATPAIPAGQENKLASTPSIPPLGLSTTGSSASFAAGGGLDSARPLSTRRLKKELLCADSTKAEMSNSAGHVTLTDSQGTPRSVRVVQQQELEDFNMVNVKWVWSFEGKTHQIVLRHGRRSGIRKIYVDKTLIERTKSFADRFVDRGSHHVFTIEGRSAEIAILPGKSACFRYMLTIDNEDIERDLNISAPGLSADIGTHFVRPCASSEGFGMTLANCGNRADGVVIIELEPGLPAHACGLLVGDVVLAVDEVSVVDTNVILDKLAHAKGEVTLEVSGCSPSRLVVVPNPFNGTTNGKIELSDTSCGVGVYVSSVTHATDVPHGTGRLELGDVILSVDGAVTESARETIKYMQRGPQRLTFVLAGRSIG